MKPEIRYNLIFIVVLLIACLPGGIMLFKKKMEPGARQLGEIDPMRLETAYVNPYPHGSNMTVIVPPRTDQWVAAVGSVNDTPKVATDASRSRLVSDARLFQVVRQEHVSGTLRLTLIIWNPDVPVPTPTVKVSYRSSVTGQVIEASVDSFDKVDVPADVQEELRATGYVEPPKAVTVVRATVSAAAPFDLIVHAGRSGALFSDKLSLIPSQVRLEDAVKTP